MPRNTTDYDRYANDYSPSPSDCVKRRQSEVADRADAIVQAAVDRDLTPTEAAEIDSLYAQFEALGNDLKSIDRVEAMNAGRGTGRKTTADLDRSLNDTTAKVWASNGSGPNRSGFYAKNFGSPKDGMYGFKDARDYFGAIFNSLAGIHDPRLFQMSSGSSTQEGGSGGFMVPSLIFASILDGVIGASVLLSRLKTVPMTTMEQSYPRFEALDRSVGLSGGFEARLIGEGQPSAVQTAKITNLTAKADKMGVFTAATNELVQDSTLFVSGFQDQLVKACAYKMDQLVIDGTGVGQPLGIRNANSTIVVAAEGGQAADTINFANCAKMYSRLFPAGISKSVWLVHNSTIPVLVQMSSPVRNVAGTENVGGTSALTQNADGSFTLLGRPVLVSEHMAPLGDLGDIALIAPDQYGLFMRNQGSVESSNAPLWLSDEMSFRLIVRFTGLPIRDKVATLPNSGGTESWCVMLAAR